ncbi:hypothetical protein [Nocardia aurea]|uniref:hypothetical protein n=1 Tax=Nocardia aurea TaxID=2144174 RepID=UPI0033B8E811
MYWVAGIFAAVIAAFANRYGYHRDELYFMAAGRRLDWGYADQPPLTPLLARAMTAIDPDSLVLLRLPALAAATLVVLCAGWMAGAFGGGRGARALAAATVAGAALTLGAGHMLNTAVFDLAAWSVICLLTVRLLRGTAADHAVAGRAASADRDPLADGRASETHDEVTTDGPRVALSGADSRWWLAIGAVAGLGMQNKMLLILPVVVLVACVLVVGPRTIFATGYLPAAVGLAVLIWLPSLLWQARNGWPQWELSRAIAGGSSGTSDTPIMFVLSQFGLMGPLLAPLWIFGWWRLWRDRRYRAFAVSYAVLFALFLVTGGKAYYLGGMYPILLAAAAVPVARWLGGHRVRWAAAGSVVAVNACAGAILFLPVLPVSALPDSPVLAINYDAGETVGWPEFVRNVGEVRARLGPDIAILTDNYGEAGAIERFGAPYDLPTPHSGHNAYWWWGPPDDSAAEVLTIGIDREQLDRYCAEVESAGRIDNGLGIENDEQGVSMNICRGPRVPWSELWPRIRHLG